MKKLLVSGAGGFVGARIMTQLAGRYEPRALPKGMLAAADENRPWPDWVRREQPDVVVHTAALSDTGYSEKHPDESYRANASAAMLDGGCGCTKKRRKAGRVPAPDQVYTGLTEHGPFDEDTPLSPANVYGRHKEETEQRAPDILPDAVLLRAAWMYDLPGYGLPIRGNFLLNLLTAAMPAGNAAVFGAGLIRGIAPYVRSGGGAGSGPGHGTAGRCVQLWQRERLRHGHDGPARLCAAGHPPCHRDGRHGPRSLLMDGGRLRAAAGVGFDDTLTGVQRCLRDYGLLK